MKFFSSKNQAESFRLSWGDGQVAYSSLFLAKEKFEQAKHSSPLRNTHFQKGMLAMDIKTQVSWVQILFNEPSYLEWSFSPQKIRLKAFDCPEAMGRLHIPAYFWQKKNLSRRNTLAPYAIRIFKREFWLREENAWRKQVYLIASDILVILIDLWHNNNWWLLHRKALLVYHFLAKKSYAAYYTLTWQCGATN